jgi:DNA-binding LytR/AlgR family response regulator
MKTPSALVADDEPLLRSGLIRELATAWPNLRVIAEARNGAEAVELFEKHTPDVCFLDVHMPRMSGIEAAQHIGRRAHVVFVTAFHQYALKAFEHGALDYLVKPVEPARLASTVERLQERLRTAQPALQTEAMLQTLLERVEKKAASTGIRWIHASAGNILRVIPVDSIDYLRTNDKYTTIAWRDVDDQTVEAVVRKPLRDLVMQLDQTQFLQIHRSVAVNLRAIRLVLRNDESAEVHLHGRLETLPVSRAYLHLFRQM